MGIPNLIIAICFIISFIYYWLRSPEILRNGKPLKRAPNTLPLVGNGLYFLKARHKLFSWFVQCERHFGLETFQISVPSLPPGIVINDPKNLEFVLKNEGVFGKGDFVKSRSWDLFGRGIINADGDLWKIQRKAGLHFLNASNLKVLTDVVLPRYLDKASEELRQAGDNGIIDLDRVFLELTTQLMGQMAYNMEMHSADEFSVAFEYASGATGERFQNPLWQLTEIPFGSKLRASISTVKSFGKAITRNAMNTRHIRPHVDQYGQSARVDMISGSLINALLDSITDENIVADAALNYLSAGRDTTAQALTWAFYLLMRHPAQAVCIREEVRRVCFPSGSDMSQLDMASLQPHLLPFTMSVFYETLRLYPPIPFEIKQCESDTTLPDGTLLSKTSVVVWCPWAMNRSRLTWGEDADDFRPGRWLDNGKLVTKSAFEFPVFNGGSRMCLGKKMAEAVAVMVIGKLVWEHEFSPLDRKERISKNSLTLPMEGGLPCSVRTR